MKRGSNEIFSFPLACPIAPDLAQMSQLGYSC